MHHLSVVFLCVVLLAGQSLAAAGFLDFLKSSAKSTNAAAVASAAAAGGLSQEKLVAGLKEALAKGVQTAVTNLGRPNGFLTNANVRIPMPENLKRVEQTLRKLKQDYLADEFVGTMNRAAESAVPEAAAIFADAIKQLTLEDAKALLNGPEDAATQFFKKTGEKRLQEKMLPIVQTATTQAGVTGAYKQLTSKAGIATAFIAVPTAGDIDQYVTQKASDGVFKMIAEQEKLIRQNPAARTTELLRQVFGK
jgi:hypothetical protein